MAVIRPDLLWAVGRFTCATPPVLTAANGVTSVARAGDGDYSATLDNAIDVTECNIQATGQHTAFLAITVVQTSDTVKQILVWDAAGMAVQAGAVAIAVFRTA